MMEHGIVGTVVMKTQSLHNVLVSKKVFNILTNNVSLFNIFYLSKFSAFLKTIISPCVIVSN